MRELAAMKVDISILSTNKYSPKEIVKEEIPNEFLVDDNGELLFTSAVFNSEESVVHLLQFLFQDNSSITEVFRDNNVYVLDLSSHRDYIIDFDYLEKNYSDWLKKTGRANTMSEYGMLLDFIGYIKKGVDKKYLLMVISNR
jgi:hypothetical protein